MSHPMNEHRAHKVEKERLRLYRASGGSVDEKQDAKMIHKHESHMHKGEPKTKFASGGGVKARADRPKRAHGGGVGKKHAAKGTHVNVIVGGGRPDPMPVPVPGGAPVAAPMGPAAMPPGAPRAIPPMAGLGGAPPVRMAGGRTYKTGGRISSENAKMAPKLDGGAGGGEARLEKPKKIIIKGKSK